MSAADERFMRRALELAASACGETNPNPMVGCVIVAGGRVVGEGFHARAGQAHAEVVALARAGARARGATLFVTLEPCNRQGRTPPCAPAVAASGIRRVVAAMRDPNPQVNGRGFARLRRAGIRVESGVLEAEARRLNERFAVAQTQGRPFVLLKTAMTLDGRIATARGESKWITNPAQRAAARRLRRAYDAVLVGIETVRADDPLLLPEPAVARPSWRIVLDSRLRLPLTSRLVRTARLSPVAVFAAVGNAAARRRLEARGVRVFQGPARDGRLSLRWVLQTLWAQEISSVMVEGGSEVTGSFLRAGSLNKVTIFRAPRLLGGRGSRPAFGGPDPRSLAEALPLVRGTAGWIDAVELGGTFDPASCEHWYPAPGRD